jgi:hypothetical protein
MNSMRTTLLAALLPLLLLSAERVSAHYDPGTQKWLNRDPLSDAGSIAETTAGFVPWTVSFGRIDITDADPTESWAHSNGNLFKVMANDPINWIDPFGQCPLANPINAEAYSPGSTGSRPIHLTPRQAFGFLGVSLVVGAAIDYAMFTAFMLYEAIPVLAAGEGETITITSGLRGPGPGRWPLGPPPGTSVGRLQPPPPPPGYPGGPNWCN